MGRPLDLVGSDSLYLSFLIFMLLLFNIATLILKVIPVFRFPSLIILLNGAGVGEFR